MRLLDFIGMNIKLLIDLLQALAVIGASTAAIIGINSWRREMRGKREYDLAEETLSLFYEVRDLISAIRSPFWFSEEGKSRPPEPGESPEEKEARNRAYVVWERYLKHSEKFSRLNSLKYRLIAVFGPGTETPFATLNDILQELRSAVIILGGLWYDRALRIPGMSNDQAAALTENIKKYQAAIWEGVDKPDPINLKVGKMISDIEVICAKPLSRAGQ